MTDATLLMNGERIAVRVMTTAEGYAMVRRPNCAPFLCREVDLTAVPRKIPLPPVEAFCGIFCEDEVDELYEDAVKAVQESGKGSTSVIQRRLRIGYNRAARLMDLLEKRGVVGPENGASPREILIPRR